MACQWREPEPSAAPSADAPGLQAGYLKRLSHDLACAVGLPVALVEASFGLSEKQHGPTPYDRFLAECDRLTHEMVRGLFSCTPDAQVTASIDPNVPGRLNVSIGMRPLALSFDANGSEVK